MLDNLTKKQEKVFNFILKFISEYGYPPTIREISHNLQLAGPNSVKKFLDILERKKYIRRCSGKSRAIEIIKNNESENISRLVPIIGRIAAGTPILAVENVESSIVIDKNIAKDENYFLLRIQGSSMIDAHIQNNDLVLIKPQATAENNEIVAVLINDDATVKRFINKGDHIIFKPENRNMKPIIIRDNNFKIIGKVVSIIRTLADS